MIFVILNKTEKMETATKKETTTKKGELLKWLKKVDDFQVLLQVEAVKNSQKWADTHDFEEEVRNGLTPEEFRKEMHKRIAAYPWKK